jgi:hypothetical protein
MPGFVVRLFAYHPQPPLPWGEGEETVAIVSPSPRPLPWGEGEGTRRGFPVFWERDVLRGPGNGRN